MPFLVYNLGIPRFLRSFVGWVCAREQVRLLFCSLPSCPGLVRRKVLVLDLDETLIHSHHDGVLRQTVKPGTPPDFILKVTIDRHPVRFFVHKRPHVDYFLEVVSGAVLGQRLPSYSVVQVLLQ